MMIVMIVIIVMMMIVMMAIVMIVMMMIVIRPPPAPLQDPGSPAPGKFSPPLKMLTSSLAEEEMARAENRFHVKSVPPRPFLSQGGQCIR